MVGAVVALAVVAFLTWAAGLVSTPLQPAQAMAGSRLSADADGPLYAYVDGFQYARASGASVQLPQDDPSLGPNAYHSLVELAVESADRQQVVEVGWMVAASRIAKVVPRLFVYHWVDGVGTCYDACGWVGVSHQLRPGMAVTPGRSAEYGIDYARGRWWVSYERHRIGYFPERLWQGTYTRAGLVQAFGEVAAAGASTCTEMGDGAAATDSGAAEVSHFKLLGTTEPSSVSLSASRPAAWDGRQVSPTAFRLGGPGACV